MILLGNFLIAIGTILNSVVFFFLILYFIRFVFSWINPDQSNVIVQLVNSTTEPLLSLVRRKVPPIGIFDTAFYVVILGLIFIQLFVAQSLIDYGSLARHSGAASQAINIVGG